MIPVEWTPQALDDVRAIREYIARESAQYGEQLWDSLDPTRTHELTPEVAAELDRRSAEAEQDPDAGRSWAELRDELRRRL